MPILLLLEADDIAHIMKIHLSKKQPICFLPLKFSG